MADLFVVPAHQVDEAMPVVGHWLYALARGSGGRLTADDYTRAVKRLDMQLWASREHDEVLGIMLSEILKHPQLTEAHLLAATGLNADRWIPLMPQVENWARSQGCTNLKATTRPGWKKLLEPIGFEQTHVVLEKRL